MWPHDRLPTWATLSATAFIVVITTVRLLQGRNASTSVIGHHINSLLACDAAAALLREPVIALRLTGVTPGGLPTLFDVWHWLTVTAWACGFGMALLGFGPVSSRIRINTVVGLSTMFGVAFLILSNPARAHGLSSIADYGGWRYGIYIGLYSVLPVIVSFLFYILKSKGKVLRTTTRWERVIVAVLLCFGVATLLPVVSIAVSTALNAAGAGNAFTHDTYRTVADQLGSGESGLFVFAAMAVVFVPSSARALVQLLRLDRESRAARRLYPLWRDLTVAAPQAVFPLKWADNWNATPPERLYRRRMEVHDAAEIVARYVVPLPADLDDLIEIAIAEDDQEHARLVAELILAAERLAGNAGSPAGEPTSSRTDVPSEQTLLRLWQPTKALILGAGGAASRRTQPPTAGPKSRSETTEPAWPCS